MRRTPKLSLSYSPECILVATVLTLMRPIVTLLLQVGLEVLATHSLLTPLISARDLHVVTALV